MSELNYLFSNDETFDVVETPAEAVIKIILKRDLKSDEYRL